VQVLFFRGVNRGDSCPEKTNSIGTVATRLKPMFSSVKNETGPLIIQELNLLPVAKTIRI